MNRLSKTIQCGPEYIEIFVEVEKFSGKETQSGKPETQVSIYAERGGLSENYFSIEEAPLVLAGWSELLGKAKGQS